MYQSSKTGKQNSTKPRGKWQLWLRDALLGRHLLKTWHSWIGWLGVVFVIIMVTVYNERTIDSKEAKVKALEKTHDSIVLRLKLLNDNVLNEEYVERKKAQEEGFVDVREYDYYKVSRVK
ncbi:MAG: hypothetical protein J5642_04250 [Bacteroidales bacterium]|nr:hypothetical protein [Bacteroidales bacterium]